MLLGIPLYELFNIPNNTTYSAKENVLLRNYRLLSSISKKMVNRMINTMLVEETDARDYYLRTRFRILPLQSTPVAAGTGCEPNIPATPFFIIRNKYSDSADAIVRVSEPSMEPLYHDNDLLYIVYTQEHKDGDDVVYSTADGAVVKCVYENKLISLNEKYPFEERSEYDHVKVLGKVIGIVSKDSLPDETDLSVLEEIHSVELREFYKNQ